MKKRVLNLVLSICFILPCTFLLFACGETPPPSGPVDLAGKTIAIQPGAADLDWESNIAITSIESGDNGAYATDLSLAQFVEQFYESNRQMIENLANDSNINTVEEAKTAIKNRAVGTILSRNPIIQFSEDGTTATTYEGSDINLETPLKTYTVQKSGDELITYDLYEGQEAKIRITCDSDSIDVTDMFFYFGEVLTYTTDFNLRNYGHVKILLTDSVGDEKEFSLNECEFNYNAHTLTLSLKNTVLTYKVK